MSFELSLTLGIHKAIEQTERIIIHALAAFLQGRILPITRFVLSFVSAGVGCPIAWDLEVRVVGRGVEVQTPYLMCPRCLL